MMNQQEIQREIDQEYTEKKQRSSRRMDERRREVSRKCPEIAKLLSDREGLITSNLQHILSGSRVENPREAMKQINLRIMEALKEAGYAEDYLEPQYECPLCQDTGYVREPRQAVCECRRRAYHQKLYRRLGMNTAEEQSFERFDLNVFPEKYLPKMQMTQRTMMGIVRDECRTWAEAYPHQPTRDMLLIGKSGLGKTYLMNCMARVLLEKDCSVLLISAYNMLKAARAAYYDRQEEDMNNALQVDVLMLDDLGAEPLTENTTIVQVLHLLEERQRAGRSTVISTNLNEKELRERYTERVASRVLDKRHCTLIPLEGDDVRRQA